MFTSKDTARCPYCKMVLVRFVLDLWQCPNDMTVYDEESFVPVAEIQAAIPHGGGEIHPDMTLSAFACPIKGCD